MGYNHDDVATRWVERALGAPKSALKSRNLFDVGDAIQSYGSHFEVARLVRNRKGEASLWLVNGNRTTNTTNRHRAAVLSAIGRRGAGLPVVTIPHEVLGAAGIRRDSIELLDVLPDWWTTHVDTIPERRVRREYARSYGPSGWQNSLTGEFVEQSWGRGGRSTAPAITCEHMEHPRYRGDDWEGYQQAVADYKVHLRARHGVWEEVGSSRGRRNTGQVRFYLDQTHTELDLVDHDGELRYERTRHRHHLGGSLIRASYDVRVRVKCPDCAGTGVFPL